MGGPREAIDAAVLAAAAGINRTVGGYRGIRLRVIAVRSFSICTSVLNGGSSSSVLPAIGEGLPALRFEAAAGVQSRATATPAVDLYPEAGRNDHRVGNIRRIGRRECGLPCKGCSFIGFLRRWRLQRLHPFCNSNSYR